MMIGSHLPLDEKVQGLGYHDFQSYFDKLPAAVDELLAFANELFPARLSPQIPSLLHSWAQGLGVDEDHPIFVGLDSSPPPVTREGQDMFDSVERKWMELGTMAPVAIATMVFQKESGADSGIIVPITDDEATNRIRWEVSFSMLEINPDERNLSCESDTYESDVHQYSESAPQKARDWEGPFLVRVDVHEPSPHLRSLRQEAWMALTLPGEDPTPGGAGPKLRL